MVVMFEPPPTRAMSARSCAMTARPSIASFLCALRAQWSKYLPTAIVTALLMFAAAFLPDQIKFVTELILAAKTTRDQLRLGD